MAMINPRGGCRGLAAAGAAMLLAGCAATNPAQDVPGINRSLAARGAPPVAWDRNGGGRDEAAIKTWLAEPMTAGRAVQIAMLKSPRLQSQFARLGLDRADVLEAIQIANPHFTFSRLDLLSGNASQLGLGLSTPLVDLITLPDRARLARSDFERAKLEIAATVLSVGLDVEDAWYAYVGARQVADMREAVAASLVTSDDLARRYYDAGNISELQLARETAAAGEARIEASRALVAAQAARSKLNTAMGLSGGDADWKTDDRLPLPVATEDDPQALGRLAREGNLSLLAARRDADIEAGAAKVARRFRLLGGTQAGYYREQDVDRSVIQGPTLDVELPLFNQGGAKVARAEARALAAKARLAELELETANGVRVGAERVKIASEIVRLHRDALIPARETVVERSQQEQNYMLIGVFELIQAKTQEYDAYQAYLESIRDYWLARLDLMRVVGARLPSEATITAQAASAEDLLKPKGMSMGMDMSGAGPAAHDGHAASPAAEPPMDPHMPMPGMSMPGMAMPMPPSAPKGATP